MTAPQDPFSTPPAGSPGGTPPGYGTPPGNPPGYGTPPGQQNPGYDAPTGQPVYGEPAPAYGQPAFGAPGHGSPKNGFGVAALVLGLLGLLTSLLFGGFVFGIPAIIFGALGRGRAKRREATNGGLSIAGLVLGVISLLISIAIIAFGVSLLNSEGGKDYQDCLRDAGGDQAAAQQCAEDFADQVNG